MSLLKFRVATISVALTFLAASIGAHYVGDKNAGRILFFAFVFLIIPGVMPE